MDGEKVLIHAKFTLRVLGATVSGMFGAQGVLIFLSPEVNDFWIFCHWLGKGLLAVFVACIGCLLEVKGSMASVTKTCSRFMFNRILLSVFYFWLGCYVMGGVTFKLHTGKELQALAHATGIIAWVVAAGDLLISCASDPNGEEEDDDDEERSLRKERKVPAEPKSNAMALGRGAPCEPSGGWNNTGASAPAAKWNDSAVSAGPAGTGKVETSMVTLEDRAPEQNAVEVEAPGGGWNAPPKGFGSF